ncbi:hypothetical protein [Thauera sp. SDU_THAU2]|uniref:hypothetical protein n=1 Tax=Thauera sp. SDU_THAU2 TaxID=3136633 RepID=UPI00311EEED4
MLGRMSFDRMAPVSSAALRERSRSYGVLDDRIARHAVANKDIDIEGGREPRALTPTASSAACRSAWLKVRSVPPISMRSGIWFATVPPLSVVRRG